VRRPTQRPAFQKKAERKYLKAFRRWPGDQRKIKLYAQIGGALIVDREAGANAAWLWERLGQEWIRTTEGVKPADLQSVHSTSETT